MVNENIFASLQKQVPSRNISTNHILYSTPVFTHFTGMDFDTMIISVCIKTSDLHVDEKC